MIDLKRPRYYYALAELVGGTDNLKGGTVDGPMSEIKFADGISKPTEAAVQTKLSEMQAEWTAQEYARNRKTEYPDTGTQFNKIYDDGLTKWKSEMVDPVKTKWPKDNSGPV